MQSLLTSCGSRSLLPSVAHSLRCFAVGASQQLAVIKVRTLWWWTVDCCCRGRLQPGVQHPHAKSGWRLLQGLKPSCSFSGAARAQRRAHHRRQGGAGGDKLGPRCGMGMSARLVCLHAIAGAIRLVPRWPSCARLHRRTPVFTPNPALPPQTAHLTPCARRASQRPAKRCGAQLVRHAAPGTSAAFHLPV